MAETEVKVVTFGEDVIRTTVKSSGRAVERWITEVLSVHRPGGIRYDRAAALRRRHIFQLLHVDYYPAALFRFLGIARSASAASAWWRAGAAQS
jgi:hypothetical protein